MVAGMLMPLDQLRAIYEVLFREGVMVAKKDRRPRSLHPHVPGVTNLQVMCAMASLRARGLVRETFAWRHFYWYLTNEGIAHLRQYLHLPPEIVPASLQRVRRPVAMVMPARRAPHVQSVQGPLGCPPKWGPLPAEDPAREERRVYRRKEPEEGAPEPPVVPATAPGNLVRPGPEPAPATDERDRVQKKTFTKWVNKHLIKHWRAEAQRHISDLYEDLRDGHNLISLLEVLSGDSLPRERDVIRSSRLPREKGRMRFHKLQNVQIALDYLRHRQVKLVNIRNDDIADGNPKLTLGLIWTIILHFQISDIQVSGQSEDMTAKEKLLLWSQRMVEGYQGLHCDNFTSSWRDGRLFNAIIHRHKPMLIDMNKVYRQTNLENLDQAFSVAERDLGVTRLLDPEDVDVPQPDEKSIITYVSSLYDAMPRVPDVQDGVKANELQLRWQEYQELVLLLLQWVRHHTAAFEERRFPSSFEEIEILWCQFLKFKEMELPAKEADKNRSKGIYQFLEGAVQAGQLKVPPGYHPLDVEKEWGKLHVAILEREKQLRAEYERLECLQRIVSKLQMEAVLCEEQLKQADILLQSDVRLLAANKAPQRAAEVERDLDKADGMIRLLFNDVQTLKDGRHPQGEQMYRRVYRLHERLVAIRTEYNLRLKAGVAAPVTQVTVQSTQRRPELEDASLRYLQDLLAWVEENQRRVDGAEWGGDLPSVEAQLGSHRGLHQSIEEFRAKIERARADEGQLSPGPRSAYRDCLGRLDLQYAKLLNSSKARLRALEGLHGFVAAATKELMWLSEKEEEEVGFDWGEHNSNMAAKKESYSALMRELELKEKKVKEIQSTGDRLLREGHPARPTVESFQAALQTQWSWMLQLCCCIEAHLKENTAYFQFFSDVRDTEEQLRKLQETLRRKYTCDRSITVTRLEDLLQDAQDEKDQLGEYRAHLSGLAKRAKAIVQLKPRSQAHPVRGRVPLLAVCDYKQVEVTVHKGDECQLVGPAQPSHWKVLSSSGSEAAVPSVCFLVPPPNQEAQEAVTRLDAQLQALVTLWHQLHVDLKSLLAWQNLSRDVQLIRSWSLVTFRTLKPEEQRQALRSLELHYQAFLRDSQDAGGFGPEDRLQAEREYGSCSRHYQQLLQSAEQGEQEESRCQRCISELKDIRLQLEACETRTVHRLRLPLDKEPARECAQRIAEQQKAQAEVEGLGKGVARLSAEAEKVLALPEPSPAAPTLRSELELTLGKLEQVRSLSAIYLEKLKTISLVIRSTQGAEEVLRAHEEQLKEAQAVPATLPELEATKAALKKLRAQAEAQQPVFDALRDELRGAQEVGERLQRQHGERDVEVERWRERVAPLLERWQAVLAQTDVRQRELEQLGRQLRYYRESAEPLGAWLQDAKQRQEKIQAVPLADSQAVREQLRQEKALLEEIEQHGEKVEECQELAKQYINAIKDYELQLVTYKAQLEPVASPAKKPKVQSGSESVIQEYVDLRTRYSELTTLTSQYIKFISETLRRMEEEEAEERVQKSLAAEEEAARQRKSALEEVERLKAKVEEARRLRERAEQESARQLQLAQEAAQKRLQAEEKAHAFAVQQKEQELQQTLQQEQSVLERLRGEAEAARRAAEDAEEARERAEREAAQSRRQVEEAERLKQLAEEQAQARAQAQAAAEKLRKEAEQEAARRAQAEQAALRQKQVADAEMEKHKKFAEQTLRQKAQVEQELTALRLQLEETDHQKSILDEELQRLKAEVTEAARQRSQVEEELFSVRVQMEELGKLKARIEAENRALILRDKDNTQRFLQEEAEKMKQVAEEAARLSVAAQEAARLRQLAEEDLAQQRALAEKMLKEKMQAVQEATRLKAEAELLQRQKELAQEQARQLQEDKEQMAQQLAEETQGFQRTLEAERQRQLEMSAEAERLKLRVAEMSRAQARAEEDAQRFRRQAEDIGEKLHRTELATQEKVTLVQTLEIQRQQSDRDAERLRAAIAELEREKEKLKEEARLLQLKSEEMQAVQQEQLVQETRALQQSFLSEKDSLLQREHFIEQEKAKLEQLFQDEVAKAQKLREEQQRQQRQMEEERQRLVASMEEARQRQHEAEEGVRRKQEELQLLERQRQQQEKLLEEENQRLRERLQRLEEEHRAALAHSEEVAASQAAAAKALPNGRVAHDGPAAEVEPDHAFDGLRRKVPAQWLQEVGVLSAEELQRLAQGRTTVAELAQRDDVRGYLHGRSGVAGLLLTPSNEKLSVYAALRRQLLSPGTALILLEAQAASGFLLDPVRNRRLTVNEAVKEGVVGPELHHKLLSAERAVTGYKDPYTGEQISLFQAMKKDLIVREHGIRLLEAQIATGGIIDPVHSHRLPVDVAYQRGYFDEEMNRVLADPSDDTKGFFDPNTHENLTYLQLLERCVEDPETGLRLLPLTDQAAKGRELVYTDSEARDVFEKATVSAPFGKFRGKTVTIWELINSEYFTAEQRRDLVRQFRTGKVTVEKIIKIVITVVEEHEQKGQLCFEGLRALVPAAELFESGVIDRDLYRQLQQGERSVREVAEVDAVRRALRGSDVIAGVWLEEAGQRLSVYEALKKDLLQSEAAVALLEAQAGTGHIIDPATSARLTVDEAVRAGLVGPELHEKLLSAEKAVTGYKDPYSGQSVSLFQALKKGLIPREQGWRLLDAQLSTGGIVDPSKSHRVPVDVACARGYLDEETSRALSAPKDEAKTYCDPGTQEPVTYGQLQRQCRPDPLTGLSLLPLSEKEAQARREGLCSELQARETFQKTAVEVPVGSFKGKTVTVWELLSSEYFTAEQRQELVRQFRTGTVTVEKIIKIVITIVEEVETVRQERLSFSGLRAPVPASELVDAGVLSRAQFEQLKDGKTSVKDLSEVDSVRTLLQGSGCLAGIYLEDSKEKVTIYEAMRRGLLRPSTATLLLEAQAATGFLVDPVRNQRLYVHEAVKAGVVGPELHEKLLSAEKAVTGYTDPYSGDTISLFQAMKKGLVLREHGIRLLEAQIATGGIIDPVHSHRLPVDVAYRRGYFDEEMNRVLADPSDDTKGFFDPNTHENLTYLQLLERCVEDPETGLRLLPLKGAEKTEVVESTQVYTEEETRRAFEETQIDIPGGGDRGGSTMSLWEVMQSDLIPEEQRARLMADFRAGRVTKERMIIIIIEIIEKTEIVRQQNLASYDYIRRRLTAEDLYEARIISRETYGLLREGAKSLREVLEAESVSRYLYGTGCVAGVYLPGSRQTLTIYQALKKGLLSAEVARFLLEAQAATGFLLDPVKGERLTVDEAVRKGLVGPELHDRLLSAERAVTGYRDPYTEQTISLFQAMKKDLIPAEEALRLLDAQLATGGIVDPRLGFHLPLEVAYQRGYLNKDTHDQLSEPSEVRSYPDPSTDERLSYTQLLRRCRRHETSGQLLLPLSDARKLTFRGLRKQITVEELVRSQVMDEATALQLREGLTSVEEVSKNLQKFLEGTSCIAGVFVDATKERLSVYQAMKKGIIRPGTAFELLEAQAATGYVIDPIKGLKLTVEEAVRMGIVGPEFKDKLLSAERAVTGYKDPYSGKLISLFQAMKKGLILKDHGIRLLEAQIATGGIIDPEESHRLPVDVAYKRGLFDEEMNEILTDPSDDTKGFFDPNTEENLTYLQLMERCVTDPQTGLRLLPLKEKKRERKTSSKSSVRKRRVVIVDPETGKEMSVYEAYRKGLIDHQTYLELSEQECEWEEITISSSDGVVKSMIIDRRSGRQYDIDEAISRSLIDRSALDQYRAGTLSITEFADMLSGNAGGFRSRSSSVGSSSSYPISPAASRTQAASWSDPTEETGPVAGILDTETLEKVSITEAMHRNLVDNITGQRLLEAQACTGGIIDPSTGERFPVTDAVNKGLVDKIMVDRINLAQKAFCGFEDPRTKTKMSAAQALKKGWLYYEAGQRFLEVQYLTGGLIEPDAPGRVPLDEALQRGMVDARTAQKLRDVGAYSKYLTCPKTKLKISYKDALDRSMVEEGTGLRLLEAAAQSSKGYYSPYSVSGSGSAAGSRSGSRTGSRAGSRRGSFDATGSGFSMTFSSSSYSSSGYGRRYASGPASSLGGPESAAA
ncbi:plectin isoform X33 [Leopardus geoffroyi]|uniref:plectin isoform X33 n=1 Tax=Leopardus geoffroyi TaxID=46844 RepID=UPI001E25D49C|nr:plectin isoform X33 [Leopardus geoffroyi]